MSLTLRILFIVLTIVVAFFIGLLLRRVLVRALRKTVLDHWIVQTLGVIVVLLPLVVAIPISAFIWDVTLLYQFWDGITARYQIKNLDFGGFVLNLFQTLLLIALGIGVARTIQRLTIRGLGENRIDINIRTLIGRIFYIIALTFTIFWILSIWQLPLTVPVTAIGILTVAITVSVQDILKDLVAGFYILLERPFHIGDEISTTSVATYTGKVEDVQLRATKLRLTTGEQVTIPNSYVFGNIVVNNTFYGERRVTLIITLPEEDFVKDETIDHILAAVRELKEVMLKPEPAAIFTSYALSKITLTLHFWIASRPHAIVSEVMYALHTSLPKAELTVKEAAGDI